MTDNGGSSSDTKPLDQYSPRLIFGQATHVGQMRDNNQDAAWSFVSRGDSAEGEVDFGLFIVADGMGGHQHGERASAIATRIITSEVTAQVFAPMVNSDAAMTPAFEALESGIKRANDAILEAIDDGGTTLTAALIIGDMLHLAHIGDSRCYLISDEGIEQLSEDHSMTQRLSDLQEDGEVDLPDFPTSNMLYRSLGFRDHVEADTLRKRLPSHAVVLLCSDGLWNLVTAGEMQTSIRRAEHPQAACDALVNLANARGGHDNITVVIAQIG